LSGSKQKFFHPQAIIYAKNKGLVQHCRDVLMNAVSLLDACQKRIPWPVMREILMMCELPVHQGWKKTTEALLNHYVPSKEYESNFNKLFEHYSEHLLIGEKAIKLFRVDKSQIKQILNKLKKTNIATSGFHNSYPFPLSEEKLDKIESLPHLMEIQTDEARGTTSVIFCTKRFFSERVEIDPSDFPEQAKQELLVYDEIVGEVNPDFRTGY
jgi:hypothetical protein